MSEMANLSELRTGGARALVDGDHATARRAYGELRAYLVDSYGEGNEHVAKVDELLGGVERAAGDLVAARAAFERARAAYATLGDFRARSIDTVLAHLDPLPPEVLAARPRLSIRYGDRAWAVENDLFFIGRGQECVHLWIHSPMLSRLHARVVWDASSSPPVWVFEDCHSENGSYCRGARVDRRIIEDGDTFMVGAPAIVLAMALRS